MSDERKPQPVAENQSDIPAGSMLLEEYLALLQQFESGERTEPRTATYTPSE